MTGGGRPLIYGHRGASALAIENTMGAFARARADGADGIELDVRLSADGELVVFHDEELSRIAGRPGRVDRMSWGELSRVRLGGGERIARLEEVLAEMDPLVVNVEIKPPGWRRMFEVVAAVRRSVERTGSGGRVIVSSFDVAVLGVVRATTGLRCGLLFHAGQRRPLREGWLAPVLRPVAVHPERVLVDEAAVRRWREGGYELNVWTVDGAEEVRRMVGLGVDGIICNDPGAARGVVAGA